MSPPDRASTPLTELDLHRLTGRAGWIADRASLSEAQLEALASLVKHPMSPKKRKVFKFSLNEFVAQYVENLTKRSTTLDKLGQLIQAAGPQTIEPDPKYPVEGCEPRPPVLISLKDGQLVAQGEELELELDTGPKPVSYDHGQKS